MILQIGFDALVNPETITTPFAILSVGLLAMFGFIGIYLRSIVTVLLWSFAVIFFIIPIIYGITFSYFWALIALCGVAAFISVVIGVIYGEYV